MRSRHCAAECRLDRWSFCIRSMSDLGQSAVLTVRRPLPAFPHKQTFSGSVGMSQWCQQETPCTGKIERGGDYALIVANRNRVLRFT